MYTIDIPTILSQTSDNFALEPIELEKYEAVFCPGYSNLLMLGSVA